PLGPLAGWSAAAAFAAVSCLALLPHIGVVLTSFTPPGGWYRSVLPREFTAANYTIALSHPDAFHSILVSLKLSGLAVAAALALGVLPAYVVVRPPVRGRAVLDALSVLPLAVPGLVVAFGYLAMTLQWPFGEGKPLGFISVLGATPQPLLL